MGGSIILLDHLNNGKSTVAGRILTGNSKRLPNPWHRCNKEGAPLLKVACFIFYLAKKSIISFDAPRYRQHIADALSTVWEDIVILVVQTRTSLMPLFAKKN